MNPRCLTDNKFFLRKKFFLYIIKSSAATVEKTIELIKLFGGQIEQFLDHEISYVLTDIPKSEWPPHGRDPMLEKALNYKVKLMCLMDLNLWCSRYISSPASSDEDEELRSSIRELRRPFIKIEDMNCHYTPSVREFLQWPEIVEVSNIQLGRPFFTDSPNSQPTTPTQSSNNAMTPQNQHHRGVKRRHAIQCEICNQKITVNETIDDHIKTENHKQNTEKLNWGEVVSVIESLPGLGTLNMRRLTNGEKIPPPNGVEYQEFLCLHRVDSVSQLFCNSNRDS